MKKATLFFLMGFILAHMFSGCTAKKEPAKSSETGGKVVAKVNGTPITEEDLSFRTHGVHGAGKGSGIQQKVLDDVISEELLYQQGLKIGLDKDPGYQAQIAKLEHQLAIAGMRRLLRRTSSM